MYYWVARNVFLFSDIAVLLYQTHKSQAQYLLSLADEMRDLMCVCVCLALIKMFTKKQIAINIIWETHIVTSSKIWGHGGDVWYAPIQLTHGVEGLKQPLLQINPKKAHEVCSQIMYKVLLYTASLLYSVQSNTSKSYVNFLPCLTQAPPHLPSGSEAKVLHAKTC